MLQGLGKFPERHRAFHHSPYSVAPRGSRLGNVLFIACTLRPSRYGFQLFARPAGRHRVGAPATAPCLKSRAVRDRTSPHNRQALATEIMAASARRSTSGVRPTAVPPQSGPARISTKGPVSFFSRQLPGRFAWHRLVRSITMADHGAGSATIPRTMIRTMIGTLTGNVRGGSV